MVHLFALLENLTIEDLANHVLLRVQHVPDQQQPVQAVILHFFWTEMYALLVLTEHLAMDFLVNLVLLRVKPVKDQRQPVLAVSLEFFFRKLLYHLS